MNSNLYTKEDLVSRPRATILITHGLGEHCGRYDEWVFDLNREDISVFRYDLPGHGRSRSGSWLFKDFNKLVSALQSQYQKAFEYSEREKIPLFLFGHSMGGLMTADFVTRFDPQAKGVILSAPALDPGEMVKPWMIRMAGVLRKIVPGLPVLSLPPEQLSRNPEVVTGYKEDPLVFHGKIRVNTGYELLSRMGEVNGRAKDFHLPLLMIHGQDDKMVRSELSKSFFDDLPVKDKTWHSYAGMYHELLNDVGNEKVKSDILIWIEQRIPSGRFGPSDEVHHRQI